MSLLVRSFRWAAGLAALLLLIAAAALLGLYLLSEASLGKDYEVRAEPVPVPTDPAAIARGQRLARGVAKCGVCHGDDLGGMVLWDNRRLGRIAAPNITSGKGSVVQGFTEADFVRAIRHGVGRDGEPLIYMPVVSYYPFTDEDVGAIIAWLRSVPPVDREMPPVRVSLQGRWIYLRGRFPDLNHTEQIDHAKPHPGGPSASVTPAYGRYLVDTSSCRLCHGQELAGHPDAQYSRNAPPLTPDSAFGRWSREDFIRMMRTGMTPDGRKIDPELMVWDLIGELNDDELTAMWLYLRSLPPKSSATVSTQSSP